MEIKYGVKEKRGKEKAQKGIGMKIVYFALNFLLVPFSAYQTYMGYEEFLGVVPAGILASVSALIFFGLNYTIMERRIAGNSHTVLILGYLLPLGISFFGNFNSIYGAQMKGKLVADELAIYSTDLYDTYTAAKTALDKSTGLSELETAYKAELGQLRSQMHGVGRDGYGPEARKSWVEINRIFNNYNAAYGRENAKGLTQVQNTSHIRYFENAANAYFRDLSTEKKAKKDEVLTPITEKFEKVQKEYDSTLKNELIKDNGFALLEELRKTNNEIGKSTNNYLEAQPGESEFTFKELQESDQRQVGTIKHSLESAFVRGDNPTAAGFASFFSIIIDIIPLGFLFLVFPYSKGRKGRERTVKTL